MSESEFKKITELTETTSLEDDDVFIVSIDTGTTPVSRKVKYENVLPDSGVTPGTFTKVTVDAKGRTTTGTDATTADIADSSNKRYVTDAQLTLIDNTSGTNTGDQNLFQTIAVSGQDDIVADSTTDTLTLVAGSNVTITTDDTTDTITISASTGSGVIDSIQVDHGDTNYSYCMPGYTFTSVSSSINTSQNNVHAFPIFVEQDTTYDTVAMEVTTNLSGTCRIGIYEHDLTTRYPGTLVADFGTISVTTTGVKTIALSPLVLTAGTYWLTFGHNAAGTVAFRNAAATAMRRMPAISFAQLGSTNIRNMTLQAGAQGTPIASGFPADFSTFGANVQGNDFYAVWLKPSFI